MGQQASREHAPLTFGYVNHANDDETDTNTIADDKDTDGRHISQEQNDFILANPHLYRLQAVCDKCSKSSDSNGGVVVSILGEACPKCLQQKRLSIVKKDLADDLEYIDQTYYPDLVHYNYYNDDNGRTPAAARQQRPDPMEEELIQFEKDANTNQQQWSRLTIGEATTPGGTKRRPRRLTGPSMAVDLSDRSLVKLSPSIGYLDSLTKLNLSNNQMTSLPQELGYLKNLRVLNISNNILEELPKTIAYLTKLKALNVAQNRLVELPASIGHLPKLVIIIANDNCLEALPRDFAQLTNLISLNVSNNPLKSLPSEIAELGSLRKLLTDDCPFEDEYSYDLRHDPPSLFESCARIAVRHRLRASSASSQLPEHIQHYLSNPDTCSYCKGPFFESSLTRVRFIERRAGQPMALQYTLCKAHWSTEEDRLLAMFSQPSHIPNTLSNKGIDTNGLDTDLRAPNNTSYNRHRAYSDSTTVLLSPNSSSLSRRGTNNVNLLITEHQHSDYFSAPMSSSSTNTTPNLSLAKNNTLLELPPLPNYSSSSSINNNGRSNNNRPRASSAASVTKRLTDFIRSNSSNNMNNGRLKNRDRSYSSSSLRLQHNLTNNTPSTSSPLTTPMPQEQQIPRNLNTNNEFRPQLQRDLYSWAETIQRATAAAAETIGTEEQQNQIEHFISTSQNTSAISHN
ncbi:hypothetical protein BDF20DRAFT_952412 [Mycotypha africana]|uniref:uncharacterized protein n=1 Tax=Mycotypha africana TaxID=64632 RepID=UPI0022FFF318|nr:uncharacterized protein BDF20DRAFT_952412 [Mycotypha africana]KAI8987788.1 hypothetical protein BDF20DRAFT_952412 [Mycotypha africana]